jgi:hypothetical protein
MIELARLDPSVVVRGDEASGAVFSPCDDYRFTLWRRWGDGPVAAFIGLNPSTADEVHNDPTVRRCIGFAMDWGMGGMIMLNIFAYRATLPADMKSVADPVGALTNEYLVRYADVADVVVAAWGVHGAHLERGDAVASLVADLTCFGTTKDGHPRHPLYLRKDAQHRPFPPR